MIPKDPVILVSYLNMKLRDFYSSLEDFCEDTGEDMEGIIQKLAGIEYYYDKEKNQFI